MKEKNATPSGLIISERRMENIINFLPDATFVIDLSGKVIVWNKAMELLSGIAARDMIGKSNYEYALPFYGQRRPILIDIVLRPDHDAEKDYVVMERDRNTIIAAARKSILRRGRRTLWGKAAPLFDENGGIVGAIESIRDITEQRLAEESVKLREAEYQAIVEDIPLMILRFKPGGEITFANAAYCRHSLKRKEDVMGADILRNIVDEDKGKVIAGLSSVNCDNLHVVSEHRTIAPDGSIRWQRWICRGIFDEHGKIVEYQAIGEDVTKKQLIEIALRESEEKYRTLFENLTIGAYRRSGKEDGRFLQVNMAHAKMLGYDSTEEFLKVPVKDLYVHDEERLQFLEELTDKGFVNSRHLHFRKKDGTIILISCTARAQHNQAGEIVWVDGFIEDLTERKKTEKERERLQAQLIQSEKMATVGTLAGGIAHEFNNLLQIMAGNAEIGLRSGHQPGVCQCLRTILETSDKAAEIVKDLLTFSRQGAQNREQCDVSTLIESVLALTEKQLAKQNIKIVRQYKGIHLIEVNRSEMQHVFLNLIINARDAMLDKGGKLEIIVRETGKDVEVVFHDTGRGIKKENLEKVFEPFFTTKGPIGGSPIPGTGLGLYVAYWIIKRHNGAIEARSKEGHGATFSIRLPLTRSALEKDTVQRVKEKPMRPVPGKNILIIDDEHDICQLLKEHLSGQGHQIAIALNGRQALRHFGKMKYDLVFLDLVMPGISTMEVVRGIQRRSPASEIVVMSGRLTQDGVFANLKAMGITRFVQKPFSLKKIDAILEQLFWKNNAGHR